MPEQEHPTCVAEDCEDDSEYLMPEGNLCAEHMAERHPEAFDYLRWAKGSMEASDDA